MADKKYYKYQFPAVDLIAMQKRKIAEEVKEVANAKNDSELVVETLDVIQACETLLRMLEERGKDIGLMRIAVTSKNDVRGYYGEGVHHVPDDC